jgi:hypothetical protein
MSTLGERVSERDRDLFVGRERELARFDEIIAGDAVHVVHVSGVGGIGKSSLLRTFVRRAEKAGYGIVWIDGRDLPPFPNAVDAAVDPVHAYDRAVVVFDSYEMVSSLDGWLRDVVIPVLPDTTIVVFASRQRPSIGWFEGGWDASFESMPLDGLSADELRSVAVANGVAEASIDTVVRQAHGSPLAVTVGGQSGGGGSMAELAARLLGDEVDSDRYRTLSVGAVARVTTPELLEAVQPGTDGHESYKWLADRSFVEPLADGVALHALVADSVRSALRERDPVGEGAIRRAIADHVYERALAGQFSLSADLQHLVVDPEVRWGFSADIGSRYRIDKVRDGDVAYIGSLLHAVGLDEWWDMTSVFFREHPDFVGIARDRDGGVGGYYVAVSPGNAPTSADSDVLLGPWLRHARNVLKTDSAVLVREAVDLTGEPGEITALLGAGGVLGTGVVNPRYVFLPISPAVPAAGAFSEALGAEHVNSLDVHAYGMELDCHIVDFGPSGLLGFQRDWIYRETGVVPPVESTEVDPARLIRLLRDPNGLSHGPEWLGSTPSERLDNLRRNVRDALTVFGDHRDDEIARAIIEEAFLGDGASHETIARRFHLSRSAYFRRLQSATARLGAEFAARGFA